MVVSSMLTSLLTCKVLDEGKPRNGERREIPQFHKGNFQYNWIGILIIGVPAILSLMTLSLRIPLHFNTAVAALSYGLIASIIGITAGYHRLYSHRSYTAGPFMMKLTAFMGAGAFQGSIKWWARLHRIHHKYVDTDKDPYDARRGFWFSHCGWFIMRMDYSLLGDVDTSDLDNHPVVQFQRKYFAALAIVSGILLPWFTCGLLCDDWVGGLFYGAFLKIFIVHQGSFFINSLCHTNWFRATQGYNDDITAHDSLIFAVCNFGEGYHNFHHAFGQDYRNGYKWYHLDPTKWYVYCCYRLGFCWDLMRTPDAVIQRAYMETRVKQLRREAEEMNMKLQEGYPAVTDVMTMDDVQRLVKEEGRRLIIVEDYVLDLDKPIALEASFTHDANEIHWYDAHPGGRALLDAYIGRDATEAMSGGVYKHTHGARCVIPELCIAHLKRKA